MTATGPSADERPGTDRAGDDRTASGEDRRCVPPVTLPVATPRETGRAAWAAIPGRARLWWALGAMALGAAFGTAPVLLVALVVDLATGRQALPDGVGLAAACGYMAAAALVSGGIGAVFEYLGVASAATRIDRAVATLRERTLAGALRLGVGRIERSGVGDVVARVGDDVTQVMVAVQAAVPVIGGAGFTVLASGIGLAVLDPWFLLALAAAAPFQVVAVRRFVREVPRLAAHEREGRSERAQELLTTLRCEETVAAFELADDRRDRVRDASLRVVGRTLAIRLAVNRFFFRLNAAEWAGTTAALVVGFVLVQQHVVGLGQATAAALLFLRLFGPLGEVFLVLDQAAAAQASLARMVGLASVPAERVPSAAPTAADRPPRREDASRAVAGLLAEGLRAGYGERTVLHEIDLELPAGTVTAVVGASGAGKSTLAGVLAGIIDAERGHVATSRPDGGPGDVVLLPQEGHVFRGPVRDDLTLARPDATDEEMRAALDAVGLTGVLAGGTGTGTGSHARTDTATGPATDTADATAPDPVLDAVLDDDLDPVSAQLLALARVLVRDPDVVVCDEATSEAGTAGLPAVDAALDAVTRGRTALVVAHRLEHAERADLVVVLREGRVVERGTHAELVAAGGEYGELWRAGRGG